VWTETSVVSARDTGNH